MGVEMSWTIATFVFLLVGYYFSKKQNTQRDKVK